MLLVIFALLSALFVLLLVTVTTIGITPAALLSLAEAPRQLRLLLGDRRMRRVHALEHATLNVIEERHGLRRLAGLSEPDGFTIRGGTSPDVVASAAAEALQRLKSGERQLAVYARCGESLLASQLILDATVLAILIVLGQMRWLPLLAGLVAAALLSPRFSLLMQRFLTTDANLVDLGIISVEVKPLSGRAGFISMLVLGPVLVRIGEVKPPERSDGVDRGRVTVITGDREEVTAGDYRVR